MFLDLHPIYTLHLINTKNLNILLFKEPPVYKLYGVIESLVGLVLLSP